MQFPSLGRGRLKWSAVRTRVFDLLLHRTYVYWALTMAFLRAVIDFRILYSKSSPVVLQ